PQPPPTLGRGLKNFGKGYISQKAKVGRASVPAAQGGQGRPPYQNLLVFSLDEDGANFLYRFAVKRWHRCPHLCRREA
ncbi:MAG: hypothetical protein WAU47_04355, partial [Desulfobaccales bacterium]